MTVSRAGNTSLRSVSIANLGAEYKSLKSELDPILERVLSSGAYILGEETKNFEKELAAYCHVAQAVGVNSGTDAILMALKALNIREGDEIILPAMTFFASVEPVVQLGARPVFADIDSLTYTLSPEQAQKKLTSRTKAILAVHFYGQTADLKSLGAMADAHRIALVEDMAQAIGAEYEGKKAGTFGKMACLSFFPTKNLGACGDGGAVITSDEALADRVRRLRNHGQSIKYQHQEIGYNSRLDELQSAILRVKLRHLDDWNRRRVDFATEYSRRLAGLPLVLPKTGAARNHTYHLYCVKTARRDALQKFLADRQITTWVPYPNPLHLQPAFQSLGGKAGDFPESESVSQQILSLPLHPYLSMDDVHYVTDAIGEFFAESGRV